MRALPFVLSALASVSIALASVTPAQAGVPTWLPAAELDRDSAGFGDAAVTDKGETIAVWTRTGGPGV